MSMSTADRHTLTALFDVRADAMRAVDGLADAGVPRTEIRISPETDPAPGASTSGGYDTAADDKGFWASLKDLFVPDEDRYTYAEAMHRGGVLVSVSVDAAHAERAETILEEHGTVDVDEREASWRKDGWGGFDAMAGKPASAAATGAAGAGATGDTQAIPEVEEELRVGKRQVNTGRVKVRSYVVETPVSQDVNLRSETVRVERRAADRAIDAGDAFRERTIEAVATSEEAVVSKDARVTGEVLVHKDATDETETITDSVRSTKVVVEDGTVDAKAATTNRRR